MENLIIFRVTVNNGEIKAAQDVAFAMGFGWVGSGKNYLSKYRFCDSDESLYEEVLFCLYPDKKTMQYQSVECNPSKALLAVKFFKNLTEFTEQDFVAMTLGWIPWET